MDKETVIRIIQAEAPFLRARYGVERIGLFGSFVRGEASDESDIDIVVSLSRPLGLLFIDLADYLEAKLGRKVDLVTEKTLVMGARDPRRAHIARDIQETLVYV